MNVYLFIIDNMTTQDKVKEVIKEAQDIAWRPTKMTESTVKKLLDAFSYSFTDEEACLYANISKPTLYRYCKEFPNFVTQKELLKDKPKIKAKMNKVKAINNGNLQESSWWLERKSKDEFSTKQEVDTKVDATIQQIDVNDEQSKLIASRLLWAK